MFRLTLRHGPTRHNPLDEWRTPWAVGRGRDVHTGKIVVLGSQWLSGGCLLRQLAGAGIQWAHGGEIPWRLTKVLSTAPLCGVCCGFQKCEYVEALRSKGFFLRGFRALYCIGLRKQGVFIGFQKKFLYCPGGVPDRLVFDFVVHFPYSSSCVERCAAC